MQKEKNPLLSNNGNISYQGGSDAEFNIAPDIDRKQHYTERMFEVKSPPIRYFISKLFIQLFL
jgi:hypothetical protein